MTSDSLRERLAERSDYELLGILRRRDTSEWQTGVFPLAEEILRGRGVDVADALAPRHGMMPELDDDTIERLIRQLDEGVPREGAVVLQHDAEGYDDAHFLLTANRHGYLRLGIEYLKAAFAEHTSEEQPHRVDVDLSYIDGFEDQAFERREDVSPAPRKAEGISILAKTIIGVTIALFILAPLVVGAAIILVWVREMISSLFR